MPHWGGLPAQTNSDDFSVIILRVQKYKYHLTAGSHDSYICINNCVSSQLSLDNHNSICLYNLYLGETHTATG